MKHKDLDIHFEKLNAFLDGNESYEAIVAYIHNIEDLFVKAQLISYVNAKANIRIAGERDLKKKYNSLYNSKAVDYDEDSIKIEEKGDAVLGSATEKEGKNADTESKDYGDKIKEIKKDIIPIRRILSMASVVILMMGALIVFKNYNDVKPLQTAYFEDPPISMVRSTQDDLFNNEWEEAMTLFNHKEYGKSLSKIEKLDLNGPESKKNMGKISLYRAVCQIRLQEYREAISTLNTIEDTNPYHDQKLWYLVISYAEKGDIPNAKKYLNQIINSDFHYKKVQAQEILKSLK